MFNYDKTELKSPMSLRFHDKKYAHYLKEWRANVKLAKSSTISKDDCVDISENRPLTSYDKLALAYMYIVGNIQETDLEHLCTQYSTFNLVPLKCLQKIANIVKSKKLDQKVSDNFIKDEVLPTLLENSSIYKTLKAHTFKPWLGDRLLGTYEAVSLSSAKFKLQFNFDTSDYKLLAMSFKNMSSLIDERITQILNSVEKSVDNKNKRRSLGIEELDALSKRLKEISQNKQKDLIYTRRLFEAYSANGYRVWNSLARGETRLSDEARKLITISSTDEIDAFLLNLCYLDDMNIALRSGLVELKPSSTEKKEDIYLYRGVDIPGALRWFKITSLSSNSRNMEIVKKALADEIIKKIGTDGFIVSDAAPMSTSRSKYAAEKFSRSYKNPGPGTAVVVFITAPGNKFKGIDISEISAYPGEQEILLPAGVKLKVTKCEYDSTRGYNSIIKVFANVVSDWSDLNTKKK